MSKIDDDANRLFDYAVESPEGFTWEDVRRDLEFRGRTYFFKVVRRVRLIIGDDDEMNLVCDPRGSRETWLYQLVGDPRLAYPWQANRIGDMEARLETVLAVSASVARNVDGRTSVGKKARRIESTIGYLLTEIRNLGDGDEE